MLLPEKFDDETSFQDPVLILDRYRENFRIIHSASGLVWDVFRLALHVEKRMYT